MKKTRNSDRLFERELGQINPEVKAYNLTGETARILRGDYDHIPVDPQKFPVTAKYQRIAKRAMQPDWESLTIEQKKEIIKNI